MKIFQTLFSLFPAIIVCLLPQVVVAQCIADAGPDQHACADNWGSDTLYLGGTPSATGGTPPYTYRWSYINTSGFMSFTAADFLNDTTVSNPEYVTSGWSDTMRFVLRVTDSNGISCSDTVVITESVFTSHLGIFSLNINEGDTISFPVGPNIASNFPTAALVWRPQHGMVDSTSRYPTVAPTRNTNYYPVLTDIMGCTMKGSAFVQVSVNTMGVGERVQQQEIEVFPNPASNVVQIQMENSVGEVRFSITDLSGKVLDRFRTERQALVRRDLNLSAGTYLLHICQENQRPIATKLVVK